mmetsp:Transcript_5277/g.11982  ORF Transcript_5277/g.11982 Transcript_5277/m.11982 type:complete len:228 (+) Transcript_5277:112-795(+)|eukprot:CAMPEP_0172323158 /NCGR_PEP_ID=MMETSP1058-20130122/48003_1 /TAXON_ID=83371 /ORGANISM="Detonula confervacea, Strain CCMP 353" /LENGTH=227 /DNA_ID=CAMNT_0013039089 /DNA_START=42 /DNA_END=725 /DNA_ORIENTATION=+
MNMSLAIVCLAAVPLAAMASDPIPAAAVSWTGELPWTLYGPGGCEAKDKNLTATSGATTSLVVIAPEFLCETDRAMSPDGTPMAIYTKFTKVSCGAESAEFVLYDCEDASCSKCDATVEADGVIPNAVAKDAFYDAEACVTWYPKGTSSFGGIAGNQTSQTFEPSVALADTQAYYSVFYGNTCGEAWLEENILSKSDNEKSSASGMDGVAATILVRFLISSAVIMFM